MFDNINKIHAVGIGGIGVSSLARILQAYGKTISGSDIAGSELVEKLKAEGMRISVGEDKSNVPKDADLLVYSMAVPASNLERQQATKLLIRQISYPEALSELASNKFTIAISGTNGKTTTTAMIAAIMEEAGMDPMALVGSYVSQWNSNARFSQGKYLVLEADEYRRAFLNYKSNIGVITNIAPDHLDYFKNEDDVTKAFTEFAALIKQSGTLVYNFDDVKASKVAQTADKSIKKISFGFFQNALVNPTQTGPFRLQSPGKHNLANALAAYAVAMALQIPKHTIILGLEKFQGTWRRFELVGKRGECEIISDYAHHPDAVSATLTAAAELYREKKVLAVFQPHQHNRTKNLFKEFITSFCQSPVNDFLIAEIFDVAGREGREDQDISSKDIVKEINGCRGKSAVYAKNLQECEQIIKDMVDEYAAVVIMGAGDIYKIALSLSRSKLNKPK